MDIRVKTSLYDLEERLRYTLGLVGDVGASFAPTSTPVVIVADATAPGSNSYRNRAFGFAGLHIIGAATNYCIAMKAVERCIIDRVCFCSDTSAEWRMGVAAASVADAFAIATASVPYIENPRGEVAPLLTGSSGAMGAQGSACGDFRSAPNLFSQLKDLRISLEPGAKLYIGTNAAVAAICRLSVFVQGRKG